jgi:hypothetical protein
MMMYGPAETWKVVYYSTDTSRIGMCTAFVEADCYQTAMQAFREQYSGQYRTVQSCQKLFG